MKAITCNRTPRFIVIALGASLFASTVSLAQSTSPEVCASSLQNVQQICSTPSRNVRLAAMLCATAQFAYISLNCNMAPPAESEVPPDAEAMPSDDDVASHQ
jgi:hypothetical protein